MDRRAHRRLTSRLLATLSEPAAVAIVASLADAPKTQKQLREELQLSSARASRLMGEMEALSLVARDRSHGPYELTRPHATVELLEAAAELAASLPTHARGR